MSEKFYTIVTTYGIQKLTECLNTGNEFDAIKIAVGDSNGEYYEPDKNQTELIHKVYEAKLFSKGKNKKENKLYFAIQIPASEGNFTIREAGLFDKNNKLLAIAKYPETLKQKADSTSNKTLNIQIEILLSQEAIQIIKIEESGNLITNSTLQEVLVNYVKTVNSKIPNQNGNVDIISMPIGTIYPLACSANYVPEGSLPCDGAEYTKAQFNDLWGNYLSKNVFDISKFTIVGTPTITGDGILQNYGNSTNYITIDTSSFNSDLETKILKLKYRAKLWSNTDQKTIEIGNDFGTTGLNIGNGNANGSLYIQVVNETSQAMSISGTDLNNYLGELYNAEFISNGTNYSFKITFDDGAVFEVSSAVTTPLVLPSVLNVGKINNYLAGQIEIREFLITVDGVEVFNPTASLLNTCTYSEYASDITTYGQCGKFAVKPLAFDSSKITTVGTPTITDDGIASNFSSSDSINCTTVKLSTAKTITIKSRIKTPKENETPNINTYWKLGNNFYLSIYSNQKLCVFNIAGTKNTGFDFGGEYIFDEWYDITFTADLINNTQKLVKTRVTTGETITINSSNIFDEYPDSALEIGRFDVHPLQYGSIDLSKFSITVDGNEVYNCVSGNTFKVPTIKNGAFIQQALSDSELGKAYNEGLPNITASFGGIFGASGALAKTSTRSNGSGDYDTQNANFDASRCSNVYGKTDDTSLNKVQPNAVAMRYFVVVATGGVNESQMNWSEWASNAQNKLNKDHSNDEFPYIIEVSDKTLMPSWYRIYSDGWCEQGGLAGNASSAVNVTVNLLKPFLNTTYSLFGGAQEPESAKGAFSVGFYGKTTTTFSAALHDDTTINKGTFTWEAHGYIN